MDRCGVIRDGGQSAGGGGDGAGFAAGEME